MGRSPLHDGLRKRGEQLLVRRADSETFFVQQPPRRLPGVPWTGNAIGLRRGLDVGPGEVAEGRGDCALAARDKTDAGLLPEFAERTREAFPGGRLHPVRGFAGE